MKMERFLWLEKKIRILLIVKCRAKVVEAEDKRKIGIESSSYCFEKRK